ncbi:MAG: HD domain-containing protein [Spirochaetaceae bacterium]|nr:MAG: HD domain-containing protein [Spirochaetaceae bacterium]
MVTPRSAIAVPSHRNVPRDVNSLLDTVDAVNHIQELDELLERVLLESRRFVSADAGTLYLISKQRLFFSYVQNDTLFARNQAESRYVYSSRSLPLDHRSLAGYAASSGESLLIDDVYHIHSDVDYSFNPSFDQRTDYLTGSMLIVPLITRAAKVVGVLQLINALDHSGEVVPFSEQDRRYVNQFARHAANAIETARMGKEMVLRMVELAELRDPYETSRHAKRVGAYAAELYELWARRRSIPERTLRRHRGMIKTAAMLHDIGKVAVSDAILKKRGKLSDDELALLRWHTVLGARLFSRVDSPWDQIAREVILNHHERWDGTGYPGKIESLQSATIRFGPGKRAEEIPVSARIVAIADVFDALISERSYKNPWVLDRALEYLNENAGSQFDPELVQIFLDMQDVVASIRRKYEY